MNAPIVRLFALVIVLFGLLVAFTSRWTVFEANALRENPNNRRILFEEQRIKRGIIRAQDGTVLAANRTLGKDRYGRRYPTGQLFAQPVGFTSLDRGRIGLEDFYNDPLTGRRDDAVGALERLLGPQDVGDDLRTTLVPRAQETAYNGLAGRNGAVVALDVKSGAVRVRRSTRTTPPTPTRSTGRRRAASRRARR
jgi:penicillin-binding protein A